jgi:thiamine-phosphate pyrophosphorylase
MERLQYISQETEKLTHLQGIEKACKAGVKWIQLRVKDKNPEEILQLAKQAKTICDKYNAVLTINDHTHVAKEINSYGLHLGKDDMSVSEARKSINEAFIIGGTANTIEDIEMHSKAGANYVGVGPFRFTTTKKKLSPVLGLEGYKKIVDECNKRNIRIPLIAIGGIELNDITAIMQTGMFGVAVSGLIANAGNAEETVKQIFGSINQQTFSSC